ncbi:hypothetical protein Tco_1163283 [Tanacetum coccineum]
MEEIKMLDEKAHAWLVERNPNSWYRAYFEMDICSATFGNGISESFNLRIVGARGKPIITMLEDIRVYLMQMMWHWLGFLSGYRVVEARRGDQSFGVNLHQIKCVCNMWQLSGIPCVNAIVGYMHMKMNPNLRVDEWYSQCKWYEAYQFSINPVYGSKCWKPTSQPPPLPHVERKMHERPRNRRIRHPKKDRDHAVTRVGIVFHEAPSSSMPPHTATPSTSNTMPPPPTPSASNTMPPPPTPSPSTSNTMPPPSGSNTMPPHPTPYGSNTMSSHATPGSNTSAGRRAKSNDSSSKGGSRRGATSIGGFRGGARKRGRGYNTMPLQGLRDESSDEEDCAREFDHVEEHRAQDKGMPEDVSAGKQPMAQDKGMPEDVSARKQPMIKDDSLEVGADLPT